jgi:hypothetical protein
MVEQDELELKPSRLRNFRGLGENLHARFRRSETGRQELRFSLLLDNADAAGTKRDESPVVAECGNSDTDRLGSLEDRRPPFNLYSDVVNLQFNGLIRHDSIEFLVVMECWSTGVLNLIPIVTPSFQHSIISLIRSL